MFENLYAKFKLSSMSRSVSRTPLLHGGFQGYGWFFDCGHLEWGHLWYQKSSNVCINPSYNFLTSSNVYKSFKNIGFHWWLWWCWFFLTGDFDDMVTFDNVHCLHSWFWNYLEDFNLIAPYLADWWGFKIFARTHSQTHGQAHCTHTCTLRVTRRYGAHLKISSMILRIV